MKGDYGTMHIELGPDVTETDADWLSERVAKIVFEKRRFRGKDILVSLHIDGDCEESPHCFGAFLRHRGADQFTCTHGIHLRTHCDDCEHDAIVGATS